MPVFMRVHNLLTSGDGTHALKWGSTNVYTEDAAGNPVYDWTILDRIVDAYRTRGMKPFVQLGFMPEALSSAPAGMPVPALLEARRSVQRHLHRLDLRAEDYRKWEELCYQVTRHFVQKYGRAEVESWWFELWNEPDIGYWSGSVGPARPRAIRWRRRRRRRGATSSTSSTTSRSKACAVRCRRRRWAARK